MSKEDAEMSAFGVDPGVYFVREFHKMNPLSNGSLKHKQIGSYIQSHNMKLSIDAHNEFMCLAKDEPDQRIFMDQYLLICLGRRPQGWLQKTAYGFAHAAAQVFLPETRRSSQLRLFLCDFPFSLISPLSVIIFTLTQLISCIQMRTFLASNNMWTVFGYLRYHSNLGFLTEGYHYGWWFFSAAFVEDNPYRQVLNLFVNVLFVLPWSMTLSFWRPLGVMTTASLGVCAISDVIRTQYYCGGTVTIEAFLWGHFVLVFLNRKEMSSAHLKLLIAPIGSLLNLVATVVGGPYNDSEGLIRLVIPHGIGWFTGVTVAYQILKQHNSFGLAAQFYAGYYVICGVLYCVGYFVNRLTWFFGYLEAEPTRKDYWAPDLAIP